MLIPFVKNGWKVTGSEPDYCYLMEAQKEVEGFNQVDLTSNGWLQLTGVCFRCEHPPLSDLL